VFLYNINKAHFQIRFYLGVCGARERAL
jgi:hypothetical protein